MPTVSAASGCSPTERIRNPQDVLNSSSQTTSTDSPAR